ncbi:MAG TPA: MFS transporter [Acidimicrobiales bacterium]|nr:MFS transporter [Acidimicrobiales bacterium]
MSRRSPGTAQGSSLRASERLRWIALVVVCFAMLMNALDQTIVNVALPTIQKDLHFSQADLAWVVDAYLVTFGGFLLLAGRLGDLFGRKRMFLAGVALFTVASAVCGLSEDRLTLIVARFAQGLGAALSSSVILAIIVAEFPDAAERAKAMSCYVFVAVGGSAIGLLVGGAITQGIDWHWIFFINVPIGAATLALGAVLLPSDRGLGVAAGLDLAGALLSTAGLMAAIYAIVSASSDGWVSFHTGAFGALAVVLLVAFVAVEQRVERPVMPLRAFRAPGLVRANFVRGLMVIGMYSTFFVGVLFLQHVLGYDAIDTGLAFLPLSLAVMVMSLGLSARLMTRFGAPRAVFGGLLLMLVGLALLATSGIGTPYAPRLVAAFVLVGAGASVAFMPLLTIAVAAIPRADAGLGSGIVNVTQQVAAAVGVAVLATISDDRTASLLAHGDSLAKALTGAYRLSFLVATGCAAAALLAALAVIRSPAAGVPVPPAPVRAARQTAAAELAAAAAAPAELAATELAAPAATATADVAVATLVERHAGSRRARSAQLSSRRRLRTERSPEHPPKKVPEVGATSA